MINVRQWLRSHPFEVEANFGHCLVLSYAFPAEVLRPLLPPGLELDTYGEQQQWGFVAVAMVETEKLRPAVAPSWLGQRFFLSGYRIFARYRTNQGKSLRGLCIMRSDTDRIPMVTLGSLFTHYHYHFSYVAMREQDAMLDIQVRSSKGLADVNVRAYLDRTAERPPPGSPFETLHQARRFAGPLPYTFGYEADGQKMVLVLGKRQKWQPRAVEVEVRELTFLEHPRFQGEKPILANAFHLSGVPYLWEQGITEQLITVGA
jgi:uncharacterized protein YqjF (DUF2071 family)